MKKDKTRGYLLCIRPDGTFTVRDADEDLLSQTHDLLQDCFKVVRAQQSCCEALKMLQPAEWQRYILLVPDSGQLNNLPFNLAATWLIGYPLALAGSAIVMTEGLNEDGEPDCLPLNALQLWAVEKVLTGVGCRRKLV